MAVNLYDLANNLARELKNSEEYKEFIRTRDIAMENETQAALLKEYKKLQFQVQVAMAGGKTNPEEMERLQKIVQVLQLSREATDYIMAEFHFQKLLSDIYKILGDVAGIDLDMLKG